MYTTHRTYEKTNNSIHNIEKTNNNHPNTNNTLLQHTLYTNTIIIIMAYVIRELCTTPAFTQPLLSSSSTNSNPNPNPSKSEEELIIADISTRSSNARFIPNRYDIWYNYYPRYDDDDDDDDDGTIKQSNISIYAKLLSFTRRAKARDAAAAEEEGKFMSQKERQRCAKAYLAFILCSLRSRQKVIYIKSLYKC